MTQRPSASEMQDIIAMDQLAAAFNKAAEASRLDFGLIVNVMASFLAKRAAVACAPNDAALDEYGKEAMSRVMDALASMEDYRDRRAKWKLQSTMFRKMGKTVVFATQELKDISA